MYRKNMYKKCLIKDEISGWEFGLLLILINLFAVTTHICDETRKLLNIIYLKLQFTDFVYLAASRHYTLFIFTKVI